MGECYTYFMRFLIILLLSSSCAWHSIQENLAQKEVTRFQNEFIRTALKKGINLTPAKISFVDITEQFKNPSHGAAMCHRGEIFIDQYWWRQTTVWDKEQVVFHELGHCLLKLPHLKGIMNTSAVPSPIYLKYKKDLLDQMFNQQARIKK